MHHRERQRAADDVGAGPAQHAVGMAAFRDDQRLGTDFFGGRDQFLHGVPGDMRFAGQEAEVGGLVTLGAEGPVDPRLVHQAGHRDDGFRVLHQLDGRHCQQDFGFFTVNRQFNLVIVLQPFNAAVEHRRRHAQRAALGQHVFRRLHQVGRPAAGSGKGLAGCGHDRSNVDAHRADLGAASAHGATVEQQFFPLLQIRLGDLRATKPFPRPHGFLVSAGHRKQLVGGRVFRIAGHFIEMTGGRTLAALDATFEIGREIAAVKREEFVSSSLGVCLIRHVFIPVSCVSRPCRRLLLCASTSRRQGRLSQSP